MFEILYGHHGHHPRCFEDLAASLLAEGARPELISNAFNIFMNVTVDPKGVVSVLPPLSKAGDHKVSAANGERGNRDARQGVRAAPRTGRNYRSLRPGPIPLVETSGAPTRDRAMVLRERPLPRRRMHPAEPMAFLINPQKERQP